MLEGGNKGLNIFLSASSFPDGVSSAKAAKAIDEGNLISIAIVARGLVGSPDIGVDNIADVFYFPEGFPVR